MRSLKFREDAVMWGSNVYNYFHISITGDLFHYFLLWCGQNDALKNYCLHFWKGRYMMECNAVFSSSCFQTTIFHSIWCTCSSKYVNKSTVWKRSHWIKSIFLHSFRKYLGYMTNLKSSQTFKMELLAKKC